MNKAAKKGPAAPLLFGYRKYWAECFGTADFLPTNQEEMDQLGWDSCDVIIVTGDAYIDHPSFGMAILGRLLEAQGFRVGIIDQPDWQSKDDFQALGKPNLFYGVTAGNMDSMINHYTADRKIRTDDAYTPHAKAGKRPDRAAIVYSQRCREAYSDVPVIIGGIEASLRRLGHYDYWSDKVRNSILVESKADLLLYGNSERAIVALAHHLANGTPINQIRDLRGTAYLTDQPPEGWYVIDSTRVDRPGRIDPQLNPYLSEEEKAAVSGGACQVESSPQAPGTLVLRFEDNPKNIDRSKSVIRLPSQAKIAKDPVLYAHASRVLHVETNYHNARALIQQHGEREVWANPPPVPLSSDEMDYVFGLPFARVPHPKHQGTKLPAYEMIRFSINIMRGCFGGCSFCSITEHEGRIIQNRSEESILTEIEAIRDKTPGFTGTISDLGGPTANMYRLACKTREIESACRRLSCVYPGICSNLNTDHSPLIQLYKKARAIKGVKRVLIASGLRYDLAIQSPEYVEQLVTHHVGGYLKIAPEHTEAEPLSKMMKPGIGSYETFRKMFEHFSKKAGKEQYLIPYFISAHPGTSNEDMINLALWLKKNNFKADQVQNFYPSPMALATTMYHTEKNPLKGISYKSPKVAVSKTFKQRQLHKALLRYHDPENWPMIRDALKQMELHKLIGDGPEQLVPAKQPTARQSRRQKTGAGKPFATQHNGLPRNKRRK